jgi:hypothetical protein
MSPRPGGEADKFGARYEGAWTVARLLEVLTAGAVSLQVERGGITPDGVEFFVRREHAVAAHQVKRQAGRARSWTLLALQRAGVLGTAAERVESGEQFHFVSLIPAVDLEELADRARRSDTARDFVVRMLGDDYRREFDRLCAPDYGAIRSGRGGSCGSAMPISRASARCAPRTPRSPRCCSRMKMGSMESASLAS